MPQTETKHPASGTIDAARGTIERDSDPAAAPLERISAPRPIPAAATATNPMQMLAAALASGIDTATLRELMALSKDWEANEARKAYADAFAKFKARPIEIHRNKLVDYPTRARDDRPAGRTTYRHATLDHVCDQVIGNLSRYGLSHSWRPRMAGAKVIVVTRITHRLGHFEEIELEGAPDTSGGKNSIQAVGSVIYYLERYGLLAILGLAPKDSNGQPVMPDDDGAGGARAHPTHEAFVRVDPPRVKPAAAPDGPAELDTAPHGSRPLYAGRSPCRIIRAALAASGKAERDLAAHFQIAALEQLPMARVNDAIAWAKAS
jgi:hypothetical protein